tara:strand:- start:30 stop:875 length:846 start_codon:yes stop_codon:yes gene_type:complete
MSHYMTALAMTQTGMKPATKIVLYWLADHHNSDTELCFPSLKTLEQECEMNRSTIIRHLEALEGMGLISRHQRLRENGSQTSTAYKLHLTPVAKRNSPCCKTQQPPVAKCDPHNPVINNLGNEQPPSPQRGDDLFPDLGEQTPPDRTNDLIGEGFKEFWETIWPKHNRKTQKSDCCKVYFKACKGEHKKADAISPAALNNAARRYIASVTDLQFLKGPLPWLNAPGWEAFMDAGDAGGALDWSTLTDSARRMLQRGQCPPSMLEDGQPNATAKAFLAQVAK